MTDNSLNVFLIIISVYNSDNLVSYTGARP